MSFLSNLVFRNKYKLIIKIIFLLIFVQLNLVKLENFADKDIFNSQRSVSVIGLNNNKFAILNSCNNLKTSKKFAVCIQVKYDYNFNSFKQGYYSKNDQSDHLDPKGILLSNGNIAIVYVDSITQDIYIFILDEEMNKIKEDTIVNNLRSGMKESPYLIKLQNDKFLITWNTLDYNIYAKIYFNDLTIYKNDFRVNPNTNFVQKKSLSCLLPNGNFVIAYKAFNQDGYNNLSVFMKIFKDNRKRDLWNTIK